MCLPLCVLSQFAYICFPWRSIKPSLRPLTTFVFGKSAQIQFRNLCIIHADQEQNDPSTDSRGTRLKVGQGSKCERPALSVKEQPVRKLRIMSNKGWINKSSSLHSAAPSQWPLNFNWDGVWDHTIMECTLQAVRCGICWARSGAGWHRKELSY